MAAMLILHRTYRTAHCHFNRSLFTSEASPSERYNVLVKSFTLKHDKQQAIVVRKLDELHEKIENYAPPTLPKEPDLTSSQSMGTFDLETSTKTKEKPRFFQRFFKENDSKEESVGVSDGKSVPKGLYIYGSTGTGKTMLMDFLYESITEHSKQRVHFNKFMLDIHASIHAQTVALKESGLSIAEMRNYDPIPQVSLSIAKQSTILCFDEFQVTDIVDAVLLNRLFTSLFHYGIICIATSNREPNQLYLNGLQRTQVFVPFLKLFIQKMDIIDLNSIDYRDQGSNLRYLYFLSDTPESCEKYEQAWTQMIGTMDYSDEHSTTIVVMAGRQLHCPRSIGHSKATRFTFEQLCSANLSSADYVALSKSFSTIFIENIPYFGFMNRNEMKRFILLIDELYNSKNRIVCLAVDTPNRLLNISKNEKETNQQIFEDLFQFDRCSSRLNEMQSVEYLDDFKLIWRDSESMHVD